MKYIRLLLISMVVFFLLACIVAFFIPSQIRVIRMIHVAPGRDSILDEIRDLSEWKNWYPDFEQVALHSVQFQAGRVVKARANGISLEIKESSDSAVIVEMRRGSRPVISGWQLNINERNDSLALQAYMDFKLKWYPWEKFSSLMLDKAYGERLEQGLARLKRGGQ